MATEQPASPYRRAVAVSGHMVDHPDRPNPRFPPAAESRVTQAINATLKGWDVGPGTVLLSGGARGADILAAEQALLLGADVWLLVALSDARFIELSVRLPGTDWQARYTALRQRCLTRFQADELGRPADDEEAFERNNGWLLDAARAAAPELRVLVVWDGDRGDGRGGTADFVERAHGFDAEVVVIDPLHGTISRQP
jgi:hypothetical protein